MTNPPSALEIRKITQAAEERALEAARLAEQRRKARLDKRKAAGAELARADLDSIVASIRAQAELGRYTFTVVKTSEDESDESSAFLQGYLDIIEYDFKAKGYNITYQLISVGHTEPRYELQVTINWRP